MREVVAIFPDWCVITFVNPNNNERYYCQMEECGYPFCHPDISHNDFIYNVDRANEMIDTWTTFNMWKPEIGFTRGSVEVRRVNIKLL